MDRVILIASLTCLAAISLPATPQWHDICCRFVDRSSSELVSSWRCQKHCQSSVSH